MSASRQYVARVIKYAKIIHKLGQAKLILAAGMPRSGSTLLYNIIRLCLENKYQDALVSCWIEDVLDFPRGKIYLIKLHSIDGIYRIFSWRASLIFYSYRDIRDVLVSRERKWGKKPSIAICKKYIQPDVAAKKYANYIFKYEDFSNNLEGTIRFIANKLGIEVDTSKVLNDLPSAWVDSRKNTGYDKITIMHGGHSTGTEPGTWRTSLPTELQNRIKEEFSWWLKENNYDLE